MLLSELSDFYIKKGIRSINLPKDSIINNIYCFKVIQTLYPSLTEKTSFEDISNFLNLTDSLGRSNFDNVLDVFNLFFRKNWINGEPEVNGGLSSNLLASFSFTNRDIAIETDNQVAATPTYFMASTDVYPLQFLVATNNLKISLDEESKFDINKDYLWFCLRPGGFILSLDLKTLGVFVGLFSDLPKAKDNLTESLAKNLFKPTVQEKLYVAWTEFFIYLKENNLIDSTVLCL